MLKRKALLFVLRRALKRSRVVALLGPRQCGKTTLARELMMPDALNYFDLEDPEALARLEEPMTALRDLRGLVVIDEIQHRPELFPVLRVLADRRPLPARFLILGSASPELLRQSSESLAGRMETVNMSGFSMEEVGAAVLARHWRRGGFPLSFLARSETDSLLWRKQFIRTFIQRDMPRLGVNLSPPALLRFWLMLAHYHGQVWNNAEPARALGVSEPTIRHYLDLLTWMFIARQLPPWHANLKKRQVKSPKFYIRDSGLLHQLLGVRTELDLLNHPRCGASWEGYAIEEAIKSIMPDESYFWATHGGAELDLFIIKDGKRIGIECKRMDAPVITPSMQIAVADLKLDCLLVIYPGVRRYAISDRIVAFPLKDLAQQGFGAVVSGKLAGMRPLRRC